MTPMMQQYQELKKQYNNELLFFRLGDFYEMFFDDAKEASRILGITLTARGKGEKSIPMCGVPHHAAESYIAKLTKNGKRVAICEQLSDPNEPGIVKRDVKRIVTPGTTLDDNVLENKSNNYVLAIVIGNDFQIAFADITTGEFKTTTVSSSKDLYAEIERLSPAEIIVRSIDIDSKVIADTKNHHPDLCVFPHDSADSIDASSLLMDYIKNTQKGALPHVPKAVPYSIDEYMPLDEATLKNLELLSTLREGKKEGSLLWVLDKTLTSMGGRMLRAFLTHPLQEKNHIQARLNATEELIGNQNTHDDLQTELKVIMDLERLLARLSLQRGNARDLVGLKTSLQQVPRIQSLLSTMSSSLLKDVFENIDPLNDLVSLIENAIATDPPINMNVGGIIRDGYNAELDELKDISREGKQFIQELQKKESEQTGIGNLKVRFNKVFGYYIEISKSHVSKVPENYIRKQTLVNAERYITPELKEFEQKVLGAEEKIIELEQRIFVDIRENVIANVERIQKTAKYLSLLDVISSFAKVALENHYCKPIINESNCLRINGGRHPVVEKMSHDASFVPNDSVIDKNSERLLLITGPNMGGKSTFLRQVALIVLMAQIGSYVPASEAEIGLVDRIFTRVGASDNLVKGQSTFMVEMEETSNILKNATNRSLVILDEVGRGTSTYDGMSIAWAIMEYLHDKIQAKTLFATHYHELISLADKLQHASNYAVAVSENNDGIVFLYKIVPGGVDRSYGIEVAKLAGLPDEVVTRANQILIDLEEGVLESGIQEELNDYVDKASAQHERAETALPARAQEKESRAASEDLGLVGPKSGAQRAYKANTHAALEALEDVNVNDLTPMDALNTLNELKNKLSK